MTTEVREIDAWDRINGWSKVADPIPHATNDFDKAIAAAGYERWVDTGPYVDCQTFGYEVYGHFGGPYLVFMSSGEMIWIPDLPSMMEWLRIYSPVTQLGIALSIKNNIDNLYELLTDSVYGLLRDQVRRRDEDERDMRNYWSRKKPAAERRQAG
jgi:hypothetical protein